MPVNTGAATTVQAVTTSQIANTAVSFGAMGAAGGAFFGIPVLALMIGALIGTLVHARNLKSGIWNVALGILTSMVLAGLLTPLSVLFLMHKFNLGAAWEQPLNFAVPVLIGGGWVWVLPLSWSVFKQMLEAWLAKVGVK